MSPAIFMTKGPPENTIVHYVQMLSINFLDGRAKAVAGLHGLHGRGCGAGMVTVGTKLGKRECGEGGIRHGEDVFLRP